MAFVNIVRIQVTAEYAGRRLDHVLTAEIADRTRSQIQRLIKKGLVHVGNKVAAVSTVVRDFGIERLNCFNLSSHRTY